ncbi:MAG: AzlD domain-containing protein [Nocardioides sp.]|uniref:AzlD domain-containing protein n=1 Tax=Nocardioides sp. TaxID=35761 RepID=UPI0039E262D0
MTREMVATILAVAAVTFVIKAIGPVLLGGRELPAPVGRVVALTSPALMAALVVTNVLTYDDSWRLNADVVGLAAAWVVIWRGGSVMLVVVTAVVVTAATRALLGL